MTVCTTMLCTLTCVSHVQTRGACLACRPPRPPPQPPHTFQMETTVWRMCVNRTEPAAKSPQPRSQIPADPLHHVAGSARLDLCCTQARSRLRPKHANACMPQCAPCRDEPLPLLPAAMQGKEPTAACLLAQGWVGPRPSAPTPHTLIDPSTPTPWGRTMPNAPPKACRMCAAPNCRLPRRPSSIHPQGQTDYHHKQTDSHTPERNDPSPTTTQHQREVPGAPPWAP